MIQLVKQPEKSNQCGQCCVAMVTGVSRLKAISVFGKTGLTSWGNVRTALANLGKNRTVQALGALPLLSVSIVRVKWDKGSNSHFVVWDNGVWLDPELGRSLGARHKLWIVDVRIVSHLQII